MAIAQMKKFALAGKDELKEEVLSEIQRLGCIDISELSIDENRTGLLEVNSLMRDQGHELQHNSEAANIMAAIKQLDKHAPTKRPMLMSKPEITEKVLFDEAEIDFALKVTDQIETLCDTLQSLQVQKDKINSEIVSLSPWENLDVPMDFFGGKNFRLVFIQLPTFADITTLTEEIKPLNSASFWMINKTRFSLYACAVASYDVYDNMMTILRNHSATEFNFQGQKGLVRDRILNLQEDLKKLKSDFNNTLEEIKNLNIYENLLYRTYDAINNIALREKSKSNLLLSKSVFFIEGFFPQSKEAEVTELFLLYKCAYTISDPEENDDAPVCFESSKVVAPFTEITKMYGMPAYNSYIDPNPFMAFFYFLTFGIMLSDAAYGVLLAVGCTYILRKTRPSGTMGNMLQMFFYCGIATVIWGIVFGSWFGDAITVIAEGVFGKTIKIPVFIDPLGDPIGMMVLSYTVGASQTFVAMFLDSVRRIKRKDYRGAIFGIYSWYVLFGGLALLFLKVPFASYIAIVGVFMIMIGGSFEKKGLKKLTGGLMALYDITGYIADILSYSRLLALCLSTAVVANVVNTMGSLAGFNLPGTILFILVFIIGHTFNLALNLLGSYVHTSRLQYIEFYGRFFEGGGRQFAPLSYQTKYVDIIKGDAIG